MSSRRNGPQEDLANVLAAFVCRTAYDDVPQAVRELAKRHLLDCFGVGLAGTTSKAAAVLAGFLDDEGGNPVASVFGRRQRTSPRQAAFANGVLGHAHDFDGTSWPMIGHPTITVLPAVLALGERARASGQDTLLAFVLGVEVACQLGASLNPSLYEAGWHATGVLGTLGAAAGAAKVLGLDVQRTANALGLAASSASGLRENFGSMAKPFHAGHAAEAGALAADLAGRGFGAQPAVLDSPRGFCHAFAGVEGVAGDLAPRLGNPYSILSPGINIKPYASCAGSHPALDALLSLVREHDVKPEEVEAVAVGVGPVQPMMLIYPEPQTGLQGKFSMPYLMAVALRERAAGLAQFSDERVRDPATRDLMRRVRMYRHPDLDAYDAVHSVPAAVTLRLRDGRELVRRVDTARGYPENPLSDEELLAKFKECAGLALPRRRAEDLAEAVLRLDELADVNQLTELLRA